MDEQVKSVMVYVGGSKQSFRCQCGCNCFHHPADNDNLYICNGCDALYSGESNAESRPE